MCTDFKEKRIEYLNNWPNVEPFEIEKKYYALVEEKKRGGGTIFLPFKLLKNTDTSYNKTISFMIEAIEQIEKSPNFSYEFIFKAYDCFTDHFYSSYPQITDKNKQLCDNEWNNILTSHSVLMEAFKKLISIIPVKACQYLYIRLTEKNGNNKNNKVYQRVTTDISGSSSSASIKRKSIVDAIEQKYGINYNRYSDTIRKASLLYRYILKNDSVLIGVKTYNISLKDRLHILVSGLLYTLRNDIMHGSSMSITKSSKTTLGTYAVNYFGFLIIYYLLLILVVKKFSPDYPTDIYEKLAENIEININLYKQIFKKEIEQ
jgi:hypothetical protein